MSVADLEYPICDRVYAEPVVFLKFDGFYGLLFQAVSYNQKMLAAVTVSEVAMKLAVEV